MKILSTATLVGLLLALSGLEAIVHLTQEKVINVNLGEDVKILCRRDSTSSWKISWYQQKPGGPPKFLLADSDRASGLSSRFTYTDSGVNEYLNIGRVEAEDERCITAAVSFVKAITVLEFNQLHVHKPTESFIIVKIHTVWSRSFDPAEQEQCDLVVGFLYSDETQWHGSIGGGTEIKIVKSSRPSSPPSLLLLTPSVSPLSEDVSVVCLAQGLNADGATMAWLENGSSVTGDAVQTGPYRRESDGTLSQTSVLKLSKQHWSSGKTYTCLLSHPALSTPLRHSTSLDQCV